MTAPTNAPGGQGNGNAQAQLSGIRAKFRHARRAVIILLVLMLLWPILFGAYAMLCGLYRSIDPTRFATPDPLVLEQVAQAGAQPDSNQRGTTLLTAMQAELQRELHSPFGWSANDLWFMPTRWLDNRANRQRGVIFATRMFLTFYTTQLAKLGPADAENPHLKESREKRLVYGEDVWGFFRPSAETEYAKALGLMNKYKDELKAGQAVFNCRSDDLYRLFTYLTGEEFLGQALGQLIQSNEDLSFTELDDRVYYVQGVTLVVRDVFYALMHLFPEITNKGGQESADIVMTNLDKMCTFDPLIVVGGHHDSMLADHRGKMARYLITVINRLKDIQESVRR